VGGWVRMRVRVRVCVCVCLGQKVLLFLTLLSMYSHAICAPTPYFSLLLRIA